MRKVGVAFSLAAVKGQDRVFPWLCPRGECAHTQLLPSMLFMHLSLSDVLSTASELREHMGHPFACSCLLAAMHRMDR